MSLWASWCPPCLEELGAFARDGQRIREAGLGVVALNVEGMEADTRPDEAALRRALERVGFGFPVGFATGEVAGVLEAVQSVLLNQELPLVLPTSFLLDDEGRVAVIYRGAVTVDRLLADTKLLGADPVVLRAAAVPFAGRWCTEPVLFDPLAVAQTFVERGESGAAADYLKELVAPRSPGIGAPVLVPSFQDDPAVHQSLGSLLSAAGDPGAAVEHFEVALRLRPSAEVANNLSWILAAHPEERWRDVPRAIGLAEEANRETGHRNPLYLDTLAIAYAAAGRFPEAADTARRAISLVADEKLNVQLRQRLTLFEGRRPYRDPG